MVSGQECQHLGAAESLTAEEQKGANVLVHEYESIFSEIVKTESKSNYSGDFRNRFVQITGSYRCKI